MSVGGSFLPVAGQEASGSKIRKLHINRPVTKVYSNGKQAWCPGVVEKISSDGKVKVGHGSYCIGG